MARALLLLAGLATSAPPATLVAQGAGRAIEGRVTMPGRSPQGIPVRDAKVVLHRVGPDSAGPLDSTRTRADGGYRFRYRASGDTTAVYFVSTARGGVSYFTPPTRDAAMRGGAADLLVFDTTSAPIPIAIRGRHVVVTAPDSTARRTRTVVEAYELSNDTTVTRIAQGRDGVTFDAPLPAGVRDISPGAGDISSEAVLAIDGRVRVNAPLAPGLKQVAFSYEVPEGSPIELLVEGAVTVLEVLVEDPGATVEGAGLVMVAPASIEGRPFKRFLARDVAGAQTVRVTTSGFASTRGLRVSLVVTAVGAAMLLGLAMVFLRKGPAAFARRDDEPEALALAVAALDAAYERIAEPTEQQKAEHYVARAQMKGRLSAALAKRDGLR